MFDPKCYDLAEAFYADIPRRAGMTDKEREDCIQELAQSIQDAIEDHINGLEIVVSLKKE